MSVVQLCPDEYRDAANSVAASYGYGPCNLSVELRDAVGGVWWGCQAWWLPSALQAALDPPDEVPGAGEVLVHVITDARDAGDAPPEGFAAQHWQDALAANGLTVYSPEEA